MRPRPHEHASTLGLHARRSTVSARLSGPQTLRHALSPRGFTPQNENSSEMGDQLCSFIPTAILGKLCELAEQTSAFCLKNGTCSPGKLVVTPYLKLASGLSPIRTRSFALHYQIPVFSLYAWLS